MSIRQIEFDRHLTPKASNYIGAFKPDQIQVHTVQNDPVQDDKKTGNRKANLTNCELCELLPMITQAWLYQAFKRTVEIKMS